MLDLVLDLLRGGLCLLKSDVLVSYKLWLLLQGCANFLIMIDLQAGADLTHDTVLGLIEGELFNFIHQKLLLRVRPGETSKTVAYSSLRTLRGQGAQDLDRVSDVLVALLVNLRPLLVLVLRVLAADGLVDEDQDDEDHDAAERYKNKSQIIFFFLSVSFLNLVNLFIGGPCHFIVQWSETRCDDHLETATELTILLLKGAFVPGRELIEDRFDVTLGVGRRDRYEGDCHVITY